MNALKPLKSEFRGTNEQLIALDRMDSLMKTMRCFKKDNKLSKNELPFQIGIRISISFLKMLQTDMVQRFGECGILTARTNNDALENFFSVLRYVNGFLKGLTVLMFWAAIRAIMLGRDTCSLTSRVNSKDRFTYEGQLTCRVLLQLKSTACSNDKPLTSVPESVELENGDENDNDIDVSTHEFDSSSIVEEDGLEYFAGYIAQKFRKKYPNFLGSTDICNNESYVAMLSQGNLYKPSPDWLNTAKVLLLC